MKSNTHVALLDVEKLEEMISELSYLRILIDKEVKPTSLYLKKIHINLVKTIENFDIALESKTTSVIEKIDIDFIHKEVIKQVVKRFDGEIKGMEDLSILAKKIAYLMNRFHQNYEDIEEILDEYDKRIKISRRVAYAINFSVVASAFVIGGLYLPVLYLIIMGIL